MNYDNRHKIDIILQTIDRINLNIEAVSKIENELKQKYPRISISWSNISWDDKIEIGTHKHAIEIFCETIKETYNAQLEELKNSLINL